MDWYVCGMTEVTKAHRLAVARAWHGNAGLVSAVQRWADGQTAVSQASPPSRGDDVYETLHALERLAQLVADAEGAPWRKLHKDSGFLAVTEGEHYWFAIQVRINGENPEWEYFADSVIWDSETEPQWGDGDHGWGLDDGEIWFRPLPKPPESHE